ncbi:MAG: hypothetical protein ACFFAO_18925 [Candidatus Hermodarchaeota archaeon]
MVDMQNTELEEKVRLITKIILTNQQKMIREEDIKNLCDKFDFEEIINNVYGNLQKVGFELITTKFLEQKYYVLTTEGKDDNITPSQYGTLALILALSKEIDENIKLSDLKEIFSDVWESDVEFLISQDYLRKIDIEGLDIVKVTPLGKAIMKNVIENLQLKNLLKTFKRD